MNVQERIDLVASRWTPQQQLHPGNVAWHGSGCDGAPPSDVQLEGEGWFIEAWLSGQDSGRPSEVEVEGHFSPQLPDDKRRDAFEQVRSLAPHGRLTLVTDSAMATTARSLGAYDVDGPFFLLQHRLLTRLPQAKLPDGYRIVLASEAGDQVRVRAHQQAWAPARIKALLGLPITGKEPGSSFSPAKYLTLKGVSIYRPELDLLVLAPDGSPAAFALGWFDIGSASMLFEPVGTTPAHSRRGLSFAVCLALMHTAKSLGAEQAVVGPRGDDAYPIPRHLYTALGFSSIARTTSLAWTTP